MKYAREIEKRFEAMKLFEKMYIEEKMSFDEFMGMGFEAEFRNYQNLLKGFAEKALIDRNIGEGINIYEPILMLRYKEKVLKGVDIEFLVELIFEEEILNEEKVIKDKRILYDFYLENKEEMELIIEKIKEYEVQ